MVYTVGSILVRATKQNLVSKIQNRTMSTITQLYVDILPTVSKTQLCPKTLFHVTIVIHKLSLCPGYPGKTK